MKHSILLSDNGKVRKFSVDIPVDKLVAYAASEYMKNGTIFGPVKVKELKDTSTVYPKITKNTYIPNLAEIAEVGAIFPFGASVKYSDIKEQFKICGIEVEACPVPEESNAFSACKVIKKL